jgi:carotenoid cleavage dioxygenase
MTTPVYLQGFLAPVADETEARDLPVVGILPPELDGRYFRNGPNPLPGEDPHHWLTGAGMLHGIRLLGGRAEWYRNRWVRTKALAGAPFILPDGHRDLSAVSANTNVIRHADRILALVESGLPYEMSPELDTIGTYDFAGRLTTAMTGHPKEDPVTGDLHFFGYSPTPPFVTYHRATADGALVESRQIDVPGSTMMHDFAITENYVVWLDLSVVFDPAAKEGMRFHWDDRYGARIGLMRQDGNGAVRWFDIDPCYVFHVGNAREDAHGRVILDAVRYPGDGFQRSWAMLSGQTDSRELFSPGGPHLQTGTSSHLYEWTLDPATGRATEAYLDDRSIEFPTMNDTLTGRNSRYRYAVHGNEIVKYDLLAGVARTYDTGADQESGEAVFVPAQDDRAEDAGWLLTVASDRDGHSSRFLVVDAADMSLTARVELPHRVPAGFHGHWLPDTASAPAR